MTYPKIHFADHLAALDWRQGEHILIAGPTGTGKTTLAAQLLEKRGHVITFATKPYDATLEKEYSGWDVVSDLKEIEPHMRRVIVKVKPDRVKGLSLMERTLIAQRRVFRQVLDWVYSVRGWCIYIDEALYMSDPKRGGVGDQIEMLHYHGRSSGISMVMATQRPAWVPKIIYSSASHAYIWKTRDSQDLKRLAELGSIDPRELQTNVQSLPTRFDLVYTPSLGEGTPAILNTRY